MRSRPRLAKSSRFQCGRDFLEGGEAFETPAEWAGDSGAAPAPPYTRASVPSPSNRIAIRRWAKVHRTGGCFHGHLYLRTAMAGRLAFSERLVASRLLPFLEVVQPQ